MSGPKVKIGIIGGSGLDDPSKQIFQPRNIIKREDAKNDFGLPSSHLYVGSISGVEVVLLSRHGPGHKISPTGINYRANLEAFRNLGCTHVLASTACGSLAENITKGQLVIPNDFIDRTIHRKNTFYDNTSEYYEGVRHIPMFPAFDCKTMDLIEQAAQNLGISVMKGATVVTIEGPRFSSRAESNMFRQWGGHLINMTTCPEVYLAKEAGLLYASIAIATDYDCWKESEDNVCVSDVLAIFKQNVEKVTSLLIKSVELIGQEDWTQSITNAKNLVKNSNVTH
ncbi:S-methyl-5'-thioadenosine phosphorylase [Trichogramma pretiosum]|uniref:S-methyl-5'-thioadenosine phosphorylase n=1 Tax=Trichogramma pretiosum TaxID=7493 RepID=UPI0006C94EB8|nr:S-methyl-5'-thioadenosine phosphorylase [Trichogramma pretiosum]